MRSSKQESYSLGLYEFLITKRLLNEKGTVSYMISELSGINTSLGATIKINPFDTNSLKKGFLDASQKLSESSSNYLLSLEKDLIKIILYFQLALKEDTKYIRHFQWLIFMKKIF